MHKHLKQLVIFFTIAALILISFSAESLAQDKPARNEFTAEKMVADLILVRPAGIVATVFGSAVFIVALPFSLLGGNTDDAYRNLIVAPAKFTFQRPLGDI